MAEASLSNFPNSIDEFSRYSDLDETTMDAAEQYKQYIQNKEYAQAAQYLEDNPNLKRCCIGADIINSHSDSITSCEEEINSHTEEISNHTTRISACEEEIGNHSDSITSCEEEINSHTEEISNIAKNIDYSEGIHYLGQFCGLPYYRNYYSKDFNLNGVYYLSNITPGVDSSGNLTCVLNVYGTLVYSDYETKTLTKSDFTIISTGSIYIVLSSNSNGKYPIRLFAAAEYVKFAI